MTSTEFEKTAKKYGFRAIPYLDRGDILYEVWLVMDDDGRVLTETGYKHIEECTYYELSLINDTFDTFVDFCTKKSLLAYQSVIDDFNLVIGVRVFVDFIDERGMDSDNFYDDYEVIKQHIDAGLYYSEQLQPTLNRSNKSEIVEIPMIDKLFGSYKRNLSSDAIEVFNLELSTIFDNNGDIDKQMRIAFEMVAWNDNIIPFEYIVKNNIVSEQALTATFFMQSNTYDARILKIISEFKVENFEIPLKFPNDPFSDILFIENISKNWTFSEKYIGVFITALFASNKIDSVDMFTKNYTGTYKFTTIVEYEAICIKGISVTSVKNILSKFGDSSLFGNQTLKEIQSFVNTLRNYLVGKSINNEIYELLSTELISGTTLIVQKIYDHIAKNILQNPLPNEIAISLLNPYILLPNIKVCDVGCEIISIFAEEQKLLDTLIIKEPSILDGLINAGLDHLLPKKISDIFLF